MGEEKIVYNQDYVTFKDHEPIEEKLKECMQGKYKLILDFSKPGGVQSDFYQFLLSTCLKESQKLGKEWHEITKEALTFVYESKTSRGYLKLEELGIETLFDIRFNS